MVIIVPQYCGQCPCDRCAAQRTRYEYRTSGSTASRFFEEELERTKREEAETKRMVRAALKKPKPKRKRKRT